MDLQIVEKFFHDTCTDEEAEQIVTWFATAEGQKYLAKRLDEDAELLQDQRIKPLLPELDSPQLWSRIEGKIAVSKRNKRTFYPRRRIASYWYTAAIILLVAAFSIFFVRYYFPNEQAKPIHYITKANQQRSFTLHDSTKVRLNSHSQIWVSAKYGQEKREIKLKGEAFFKVHHNAAKPFVIHARRAVIKDVGTAFDVRADSGEANVQVAVKSGGVTLRPKGNPAAPPVKLTGGQFGYLNLKTDSISVDEFVIANYLSWMNGRLKFDNAPLKKVSKQLSRIYNVSFAYDAASLKRMKLSANFKRGSLKKALAVISLTLSIKYKLKNHHVTWSG